MVVLSFNERSTRDGDSSNTNDTHLVTPSSPSLLQQTTTTAAKPARTPKREDLKFFQHMKEKWESRPKFEIVPVVDTTNSNSNVCVKQNVSLEHQLDEIVKLNQKTIEVTPTTTSADTASNIITTSSAAHGAKNSQSSEKNVKTTAHSNKQQIQSSGPTSSKQYTGDVSKTATKVRSSKNSETPSSQEEGRQTKEENKNDYKERLIQFYQKYNPSKLASVDATLVTYQGKEEELFEKLTKKYCSNLAVPEGDGPRCFLNISIGDDQAIGRIVIKLYQDKCPLTANSFYSLCTNDTGKFARSGQPLHFKGSTFHRIIRGFVAQGGDFTKHNGTGGESIYRGTSEGDMWGKFKDEHEGLQMSHCRRGLLSMANSGKNTNGSQFFITFAKCTHLDGKHVIFGEVIDGWEQLNRMEDVLTDTKSSKPLPEHTIRIMDCGTLDPNPLTNQNVVAAQHQSTVATSTNQTSQLSFGQLSKAAGSGSTFGGGGGFSFGQQSKPSTSSFSFGQTASGTNSSLSSSNQPLFGATTSSFGGGGFHNNGNNKPNIFGSTQTASFGGGSTANFSSSFQNMSFKPSGGSSSSQFPSSAPSSGFKI